MKKLLLTAALAIGAFNGSAHAYTFDVWNGANDGIQSKAVADSTVPTGAEYATFTYSGLIDFKNNNGSGGSNTFGDFFHNSSAVDVSGGISGISLVTTPALLAKTMSTPGDGDVTFIKISGLSLTAGSVLKIDHDDGGTVYMNGIQVCGNPSEASLSSQTCTIVASGAATIYYTEDNGSPADLTISVPEPASMALMGVGLLGLGLIGRRRRG